MMSLIYWATRCKRHPHFYSKTKKVNLTIQSNVYFRCQRIPLFVIKGFWLKLALLFKRLETVEVLIYTWHYPSRNYDTVRRGKAEGSSNQRDPGRRVISYISNTPKVTWRFFSFCTFIFKKCSSLFEQNWKSKNDQFCNSKGALYWNLRGQILNFRALLLN